MKIRNLSWHRFRVPLVTPFETAHGVLAAREGLLLRLATDAELAGWGEVSPVHAFHGADVRQTGAILKRWAPASVGATVETLDRWLATLDPDEPGAAAVRCGLDVALHDLLARERGISVAALLGGAQRSIVPVNATVTAADPVVAVRRAREAAERGFRCIKLKVGHLPTAAAEVARVAAVREAIGSDLALRLDANGAWDVERAVAILRALATLDLELVEQPVPAGDIEGLARVRRVVGVPIAADEAVTGVRQARAILGAGAADVLIVKPMVVGGVQPGREILTLAAEAGAQAIVTTTVDAGIGVAAALHLAATMPGTAPACGLATAPALVANLVVEPLLPRNGVVHLPDGPGLGVEVDLDELQRFGW